MLRSSASARSSSYVEGPTGLQVALGLHGASSFAPSASGETSARASGVVAGFFESTGRFAGEDLLESEGSDGMYGFGSAACASCAKSALATDIATPFLIRCKSPGFPRPNRARTKSLDSEPTSGL